MTVGTLEGLVALVTGAAGDRGQGAAEARAFVREGAHVVLTDIRDHDGDARAAELGEAGEYHHLDVTSAAAWDDLVNDVTRRHGRLDILVNNAGVWLAKGLLETSVDEYRRVIEINQLSVFLGMRTVAPVMQAAGGGSIVNISSTAGLRGAGQPHAYTAAKWAVRGMSKQAAHELAPFGVRVNSVHPGVIDTPMISGDHDLLAGRVPMGRLGTPEEVAALVLFLASPASSYVSGAEISVDGAVAT